MTDGKASPQKPSKPRRPRAQTPLTPQAPQASDAPKAKTAARPRRAQPRAAVQDGPTRLNVHERHALVAQAAYFRAQARGFAPGRELEDWVAAESEVGAQLGHA